MLVDLHVRPEVSFNPQMSFFFSFCVMSAGHVSFEWFPCRSIQY